MNKETLIEALEIAKNNFDYDGEYDKAAEVLEYLKELEGKEWVTLYRFTQRSLHLSCSMR